MTHDALLPNPALFDVTAIAAQRVGGTLERIELEHLELAPNKRRDIAPESIQTLAAMLARTGQLVPCIGYRPDPGDPKVVLCAGQRRLLAARASPPLAGTPGFEGLAPVRSLVVLLLDHAPGDDQVRRIQAQENAREPLSLRDQQEQFRDCWQARIGLPDADRMAVVFADLGISAGKGHSPRRQPAPPAPIRERVAERPADGQLSVRMAHRLADMHDVAPELATAVATRVTTTDLHDQALRDLGGFVHRTVVENDDVYAVRIDDGVLLDAAEQIDHARRHLTPADRTQAAAALGCKTDKLDAELDTLAARARSHTLKLRVDGALRDRAAKAATPGRSTAARTSPRASGSSTPSSWSTPSASSSATPTPRPSARIAISLALDSTTTTCASPPRTTASAGPPSARGTPKRPRAISASATTSAPPWPTRPTTSCTPCGRSSAACSARTTATSSPTAPAGPTSRASSLSATPAATSPATSMARPGAP